MNAKPKYKRFLNFFLSVISPDDFVKRNIITKKHPYNDIDEMQCITHEIILGKQNKPTSCSLSVHEYNCVGKAIVINENTAHNLVTILSVLSYPSYAQK